MSGFVMVLPLKARIAANLANGKMGVRNLTEADKKPTKSKEEAYV